MNIRSPIGKNRLVEWKQGDLTIPLQSPEDRDPNIIIILADDLGYNGELACRLYIELN